MLRGRHTRFYFLVADLRRMVAAFFLAPGAVTAAVLGSAGPFFLDFSSFAPLSSSQV